MKKIVGFFQVSPTMDEKKPYLAVILIQTIYSGMFLLSKAAFNGGMNNFVFVFYRQAAATLFLTPIALFFEWKNMLPLSFVTFFKIFLLSLFGITLSLDIYGIALVYTSATLAAATSNCLPVITFFLALLLGKKLNECLGYELPKSSCHGAENPEFWSSCSMTRMEMLKLKTTAGIAKLIGILVCTAGAVTLALYKGPHWKLLGHPHFFGHPKIQQDHGHVPSEKMWIKGCFLMLVSNTLWGLWLVLQAQVMKSYRSKLLFTTFQCFLSSIQSFAFAIAFERDPNQWKLGWNVRLLAVSYCGIVVTGVTFYLQTWVIEKKGPVFLAMSTPLALIITMFSSAILLGEIISLGSLLGGILLVGGLYSVLWGKSREQKVDDGSSFTTEVNKEGLELKEAMASKTTPSLLV